jgi:glutamyl-tRNA synthetase
LPEALINYLGMMGWSMPDEQEIFSPAQMAENFLLKDIHLGGPVFDMEKLSWLNGQYLRAMDPDDFMDRIVEWGLNRDNLRRLVPLIQQRTEKFSDLVGQVDYLVGDRKALTAEDFAANGLGLELQVQILDHLSRELDALRGWQRDTLFETAQSLAKWHQLKIRDYLKPAFVALSGREVSLPLFDSMVFLGPDLTRVRLREALNALGVSKKQAKRLEKQYREYRSHLNELEG